MVSFRWFLAMMCGILRFAGARGNGEKKGAKTKPREGQNSAKPTIFLPSGCPHVTLLYSISVIKYFTDVSNSKMEATTERYSIATLQ